VFPPFLTQGEKTFVSSFESIKEKRKSLISYIMGVLIQTKERGGIIPDIQPWWGKKKKKVQRVKAAPY